MLFGEVSIYRNDVREFLPNEYILNDIADGQPVNVTCYGTPGNGELSWFFEDATSGESLVFLGNWRIGTVYSYQAFGSSYKPNSMFVAMQFSIIARVHNYVVLISSSVYMKQTALW